MKSNKWTLALAAAGVVSVGTVVQAEEQQHQVMTALSATTLSGYVETSAIWKPQSPNGALPGRTFDGGDRTDGFNLHGVKLVLEKPLEEGQWSAGYKADLVFGPDANYYSSAQNGGVTFASPVSNDDFAVKQAYVQLRAPVGTGLDIKMGVWDTIIGYEVFESGNNPNFSRSFGYFLEPTHHTGVLLSYKLIDAVSVSGGIANSYTGPVNDRTLNETHKTYLGSITVTLPDSMGALAGSAFYAGIVNGENSVNSLAGVNNGDTVNYYVGTTLNTGMKGLSVGAAMDYREDGVNAIRPGDNYAWVGAGYISYAATEKLKLNTRAEYTKASNGTYFTNTSLARKNELGELTFTADYSLWTNVITRGEVRWDHSFNSERPYGGTDLDKNAVTLAANVIYKF